MTNRYTMNGVVCLLADDNTLSLVTDYLGVVYLAKDYDALAAKVHVLEAELAESRRNVDYCRLWHTADTEQQKILRRTQSETSVAQPEPNFLFDMQADFCDRHETAFKLGDRCPKCAASEPDLKRV